MKKYKLIFSKNTNKRAYGSCIKHDRNNSGEIIIYKDCQNKLKTLIHEIIHSYLFEKSKQGYKSRFIDKLNEDENFIDGLAIQIAGAIKENKKIIEGLKE